MTRPLDSCSSPCWSSLVGARAPRRARRVERATPPGASAAAASRPASGTTPSWSCCTPACWSVRSPRCGCSAGPSCRRSAGRCSRWSLASPGAAVVVHRHARAPVEHPRDRRARPAAGPPRPLPVAAAHPNYVAVVVEGFALPLVHTAWITAVVVHRAQRRAAAGAASGPRTPRCAVRCRQRPAADAAEVDLAGRRRRARSGSRPRRTPTGRAVASWSSSREPAPIDKACGEGLMPARSPRWPTSVSTLRSPAARDPVRRRRPVGRGGVPAGLGRGVRRTTLHDALRAAVDAAGVRCPGRVTRVSQDGASVRISTDDPVRPAPLRRGGSSRPTGSTRRCGGCSGSTATHARTARPRAASRSRAADSRPARRFGLRHHVAVAPWSAYVEVHWARKQRPT